MSVARLVVTAVRIEGRHKTEVSRDYGVSPRWVYELVRRFDAEGEAGPEPRSRRPRGSPRQTPVQVEEEIVELRKALADEGLDAGAHTIAYHLTRCHGTAPAVSTIWRIDGAHRNSPEVRLSYEGPLRTPRPPRRIFEGPDQRLWVNPVRLGTGR